MFVVVEGKENRRRLRKVLLHYLSALPRRKSSHVVSIECVMPRGQSGFSLP